MESWVLHMSYKTVIRGHIGDGMPFKINEVNYATWKDELFDFVILLHNSDIPHPPSTRLPFLKKYLIHLFWDTHRINSLHILLSTYPLKEVKLQDSTGYPEAVPYWPSSFVSAPFICRGNGLSSLYSLCLSLLQKPFPTTTRGLFL